jgi:hypothetical protein
LTRPTDEPTSNPGVPRRVSEPGAQSAPLDVTPRPLPTARIPTSVRFVHALPWILVVLPALYQLLLLATAISGRIGYPYDLEWMEGGMLHHALRIKQGEGIYGPPSIDFIPYLYTPLYPAVLALFGISYYVGRLVSVLSLIGTAIVTSLQISNPRYAHVARGPLLAGLVLAMGLFAASYPYMEGWFDLVRADTLFLFMVTAGIGGLTRWSRAGAGFRGHARVAAGAALLALAFFCKQTGIIYVGFGGAVVLVLAWRRLPIYVATAGLVGLGGTWLLNKTTHGWFWIYVSKIHRAHDFNMDRFWKSFGNILLKFPAMTAVVAAGIVIVGLTWWKRRALPKPAQPFVLWTAMFAVSTVVGAVGWGTEFAHFNAYMPAFLHGALAAGAALPAIYECWRLRNPSRENAHTTASAAAFGAALLLAATCWSATWKPAQFIPTGKDEAAGQRLIARIHAIDGEVWMPSHPWYLHLAGKRPYVHRMGVKDVTARQARVVAGLDDAIRSHRFAALVLDDRDLHLEQPILHSNYRPAMKLPGNERPRLFTGAKIVPDTIWVPMIRATPPAGTVSQFDFEQLSWDGWKKTGPAWGNGPAQTSLPGQPIVLGATGQRFATSAHDGDLSTGRITSPPFKLDATQILLHAGGGDDATKLRIELWVDDKIIGTTSVPPPGGETLVEVAIDVAPEHRGKQGTLVFVDDAQNGHLTVDDVWLVRPR